MADSIRRLKRRARHAYDDFFAALSEMDCGIELAKDISITMATDAQRYNEAMTTLLEIDPECPKFIPL